ncbi:hypothetical protein V6Z11_1Z144500 [Gossypium hirsutum]
MGNGDFMYPSSSDRQCATHRVAIPSSATILHVIQEFSQGNVFPRRPASSISRTKRHPGDSILGLQYFLPILEWAPRYSFQFLKSDLVAGITIASLAIPQGISYAKLANLPPILSFVNSSFIPPLVIAMMGSSRDLAVGTVAVASLLTASMLGQEVNASQNPTLFLHLAFTATFFAGILQASLGLLRITTTGLSSIFLSHATIVGFMAGAANCMEMGEWCVVGVGFLFFLLVTRYFSKRRPKFFWISAMAPLTSVILGSLLVCLTHAEKHGVQVIGNLKKGLNPLSFGDLEGIAVGRSFAMFKHYHIDGNKEMVAIGTMNIVGSCFLAISQPKLTCCCLYVCISGPFSRSVNFNAGCKTAMSNVIMAIAVMLTLLFLTPLFYYTPLVVSAIHLWNVDKFDFLVCIGAYAGVVFASVEVGLVAVAISVVRLLLFVARPRTSVLGNLPDSTIYRNIEQYPNANHVHGVLILEIDAPIYFANSKEDKLKATGKTSLQYVILDMTAVGNIDTSGISMLEELKKTTERRELKVLFLPYNDEKLNKSKFLENIGQEWIYLTLHTCKPEESQPWNMFKLN